MTSSSMPNRCCSHIHETIAPREYTVNYPAPVQNVNNMHTTALISWVVGLREIWKAGRSCLSSPMCVGDSCLLVDATLLLLPLTVVCERSDWRALIESRSLELTYGHTPLSRFFPLIDIGFRFFCRPPLLDEGWCTPFTNECLGPGGGIRPWLF